MSKNSVVIVQQSLTKENKSVSQLLQVRKKILGIDFLLDASSSMRATLANGETAYTAAVRTLGTFDIDKVWVFGESIKELPVSSAVNYFPEGSTPMFNAVKRAFEQNGKSEMFIISDGEPTDESPDLWSLDPNSGLAVIDVEKSWILNFCKTNNIKLHGIFIGSRPEANGAKFMEMLCIGTGGNYSFTNRGKIEFLGEDFAKLLGDGKLIK